MFELVPQRKTINQDKTIIWLVGDNMKKYPTLYGKSKAGKIKVWDIYVKDEIDHAVIHISHGYLDGKKQIETINIREGKNIGKSNETTCFQQACLEAESKWTKKKEKDYAEKISSIKKSKLPMLAKKYRDFSHKITYPCYVQPKLDGVRCISEMNDSIHMTSRGGKEFETLQHIKNELKSIMDESDSFDGEVYVHGVSFQDLISAIKNVKSKDKAQFDADKLEYHIYDIPDDKLDFSERLSYLRALDTEGLNHIKIVPTILVQNESEMKKMHQVFLSQGYEGTIIRNKLGKYKYKYRSDDLQKYKDFLDEEFKIIDVKSGTGRYEKCGTFICVTSDNKTFDCNMKGTMEQKQKFLSDKDRYIGKLLTVKFQEKSKDGIPRFPVGISVRDYE